MIAVRIGVPLIGSKKRLVGERSADLHSEYTSISFDQEDSRLHALFSVPP